MRGDEVFEDVADDGFDAEFEAFESGVVRTDGREAGKFPLTVKLQFRLVSTSRGLDCWITVFELVT